MLHSSPSPQTAPLPRVEHKVYEELPSNMSLIVRDTEVATLRCTINLWLCSLLSSSSPANKVVYYHVSKDYVSPRPFWCGRWIVLVSPSSMKFLVKSIFKFTWTNSQPLFTFIFRYHEGLFDPPLFQCLNCSIRLWPLHENFHKSLLGR